MLLMLLILLLVMLKIKKDADNDDLIEDEDITIPDSYDFNFNPSKIVNTSADNYTLTVPSHALGTNVSLDSSQMKVTVSFNYYLVNTNYNCAPR